MGAGSDGPLGGMAGMEPHHMNGSIGKKEIIFLHGLLIIQSECLFCHNACNPLSYRVR